MPSSEQTPYCRLELPGGSETNDRGTLYQKLAIVFHVWTDTFDQGDAIAPQIRRVFANQEFDWGSGGVLDCRTQGWPGTEQTNLPEIKAWETVVTLCGKTWEQRIGQFEYVVPSTQYYSTQYAVRSTQRGICTRELNTEYWVLVLSTVLTTLVKGQSIMSGTQTRGMGQQYGDARTSAAVRSWKSPLGTSSRRKSSGGVVSNATGGFEGQIYGAVSGKGKVTVLVPKTGYGTPFVFGADTALNLYADQARQHGFSTSMRPWKRAGGDRPVQREGDRDHLQFQDQRPLQRHRRLRRAGAYNDVQTSSSGNERQDCKLQDC